MIISGKATAQRTQQLAARHPGLVYNPLGGQSAGSTGLVVSQAGFGGYRIEAGNETHQEALRHALRQGINLIDTSSNYADGRSEELVGLVVGELVKSKELAREEIVVVSKAGYLQGENYLRAVQRKEAGNPFPNIVKYAQGLDHCIHPEFLEDQLTRSLERLNLDCIDVYLLHNPEYYLSWAHRTGIALGEARKEYYRRIKLAFAHLETEVARGRIQVYGISSNTFPSPATDPKFTSLANVWEIAEEMGRGLTRKNTDEEKESAESGQSFDKRSFDRLRIRRDHHFQVVQWPMNLLETGAVTERNQPDGSSALALAQTKGLAVLVNRPLNAIKGESLTRLADVLPPSYPTNSGEVSTAVIRCLQLEEQFHHQFLPAVDTDTETQKQLQEYLAVGLMLQGRWGSFGTYQNWRDVHGRFLLPRLQNAIHFLSSLPKPPPGLLEWLEGYVAAVNDVLGAVGAFYQAQAAADVKVLRGTAVLAEPDWQADTLSQIAIRALRSTAGVTSVLVGIRRPNYVDDVTAELKRPVEIKERNETWENLKHET
ncbi:MAG: aldo/keto reductase [Ardenticatenaceae bacterium]|nr:aldo/keto reductase [Ardenticatenaceae bacterium]MCB9444340.1 aldo/keto reductase [Ardenticatenaceae bacterium]